MSGNAEEAPFKTSGVKEIHVAEIPETAVPGNQKKIISDHIHCMSVPSSRLRAGGGDVARPCFGVEIENFDFAKAPLSVKAAKKEQFPINATQAMTGTRSWSEGGRDYLTWKSSSHVVPSWPPWM
jgi:hypothetical protein